MAYFEPSIDADGIHIPTYLDIMDYLIVQYKSIFGDDVYIGEETKDYQLLSVFAKCLDDYAALVIDSYNARNPNYATGNSLDLLLPLVSMVRRPATASTAVLKLTGVENTVIAPGKVAIDKNGVLWNLDNGVTLDENGVATVGATCNVKGAIPAPVGSINGIYTPVVGWDSVTNEEDGDVGLNVETDDEVRVRRRNSVNLQNNGTYDAVVRALLNLEVDNERLSYVNVVSNDSGSTNSDGIPGHSICCVVDGLDGNESTIAEAIWKSKAPGIGTYGGANGDSHKVSVQYVDDYGHTNTVNFARPVISAVDVVVTINTTSEYDAERVDEIIKGAVLNEINSLGIGKSWGVTTAYRDIYNAFYGEVCPFVISSVTGKTSGMSEASTVEVPCSFNELLTCGDTNITIVVS